MSNQSWWVNAAAELCYSAMNKADSCRWMSCYVLELDEVGVTVRGKDGEFFYPWHMVKRIKRVTAEEIEEAWVDED